MTQLRPAQPQDVELILRFVRELAAYEKLEHEVVATEAGLDEHLFGPDPRAEAIIAERDGEPVGFALFFHNFSTFLGRPGLYVEDLYVVPRARGHGVGRALLVHLAGIARARGCGRMEWAVLDWNTSARGFYRSIGGVEMGDWLVTRVTGPDLDALAALPLAD